VDFLVPVVLNHNNVVLDGHHRVRACVELGLTASYRMKAFTGRPLDEMHVVNVNLQRRNLNEFQRPGTLTAVDAEHDDAGNAVAERKTD
jgi:ParB-like chromosome segregation protein Spo0J